MTAVERAADVIAGTPGFLMDPSANDIAQALADAGLLIPDGDGRHLIQFSDDAWTILHPLSERIAGPPVPLFNCFRNWTGGDPGVRGVFVLNDDDTIGEGAQP